MACIRLLSLQDCMWQDLTLEPIAAINMAIRKNSAF